MRWLIDGYNLMHAAGAVGDKEVSGKSFRRRRRRFLSTLADALGPERARETTIVFDANSSPGDFDLDTTFLELHLIFALGDESADDRIEQLIAAHSAPKSLTVVSTDHRLRRAAARRKARAVTSDRFLDELETFRGTNRAVEPPAAGTMERSSTPGRDVPLSSEEEAYWLNEFAGIDDSEEVRQAFASEPSLLTDDDIARIQREVDREPPRG